MSNLTNNLIPRLKKFAVKIELKEALVDKVWVIYGDMDSIDYEFKRKGGIVVTKNGNSYDGVWEILGSGRLQIKTDFANNVLDYNFSVKGMLVMKIAGMQNEPFLLYDPVVVENGNIGNYLEHLETKNVRNLEESELTGGISDDALNMLGGIAVFLVVIFIIIILVTQKN